MAGHLPDPKKGTIGDYLATRKGARWKTGKRHVHRVGTVWKVSGRALYSQAFGFPIVGHMPQTRRVGATIDCKSLLSWTDGGPATRIGFFAVSLNVLGAPPRTQGPCVNEIKVSEERSDVNTTSSSDCRCFDCCNGFDDACGALLLTFRNSECQRSPMAFPDSAFVFARPCNVDGVQQIATWPL